MEIVGAKGDLSLSLNSEAPLDDLPPSPQISFDGWLLKSGDIHDCFVHARQVRSVLFLVGEDCHTCQYASLGWMQQRLLRGLWAVHGPLPAKGRPGLADPVDSQCTKSMLLYTRNIPRNNAYNTPNIILCTTTPCRSSDYSSFGTPTQNQGQALWRVLRPLLEGSLLSCLHLRNKFIAFCRT